MIINLVGRVGTIPQLKESKNGVKYYLFSVAYNDYYGKQPKTLWFNLISFEPSQWKVIEKCTKGSAVEFCGDLQISASMDETTKEPRINLNVNILKLRFYRGFSQPTHQNQQGDGATNDGASTHMNNNNSTSKVMDYLNNHTQQSEPQVATSTVGKKVEEFEEDLPF